MTTGPKLTRRCLALGLSGLLIISAACSPSSGSSSSTTAAPAPAASGPGANPLAGRASVDPALAAELAEITESAMRTYDLGALIVRVTRDGEEIYTAALGESMTGVPATPEMHVRNGAFAFTYIGTIVAQLVDQGKMRLDDALATWMPALPNAEKVTIRNLLNMTSGYPDYVYTPEVIAAVEADPFRQWTGDELIGIGTSLPLEFEPGTNWGYSHTNYVILGKVLEKVVGRSMPEVMEDYIIEPMGLTNTSSNDDTPAIPSPALHTFTGERRETLQVPEGVAFTEESTFWNPSWTTAQGAVQTTDVYDLTTSLEKMGSGALVSPEMYEAQTGKVLVGFGAKDPTGKCRVCTTLTAERAYGLGVMLTGPWIVQVKSYAGSGASGGYLPSSKYAIAVVSATAPDPFGAPDVHANASTPIFRQLAAAVAPDDAPPPF